MFFLQDIKWHNEWHPRIVFFNALEIEKMEKNHYLFYEPGNEIPYAVETYRIKGNFRENLELWDFPLDYQVFYFNLFILCNCFITLLYLSIKLEFSLLGECFCVSLPSALSYRRPLSRRLLQRLHNNMSVICGLVDFNPFNFIHFFISRFIGSNNSLQRTQLVV